ncbi:hypothetical protein [Salipiger mucosus]|uniref:Uncharacterized protein n=1 Tax=Salipiger mucosus DSM 16094 TaxID=1123237 RepID=S9Q4E9_9RHOB|nr:hypothetical protein [Salipiger mucosus]EPX76206.1 hypothetical protein Salmuc_01990 [Salipiger mucosus DSM 16094]
MPLDRRKKKPLMGLVGGIGVVTGLAGAVGLLPGPLAIVLTFGIWIIGALIVELIFA